MNYCTVCGSNLGTRGKTLKRLKERPSCGLRFIAETEPRTEATFKSQISQLNTTNTVLTRAVAPMRGPIGQGMSRAGGGVDLRCDQPEALILSAPPLSAGPLFVVFARFWSCGVGLTYGQHSRKAFLIRSKVVEGGPLDLRTCVPLWFAVGLVLARGVFGAPSWFLVFCSSWGAGGGSLHRSTRIQEGGSLCAELTASPEVYIVMDCLSHLHVRTH
eukprot:1344595-Amphidinium_carterae.5